MNRLRNRSKSSYCEPALKPIPDEPPPRRSPEEEAKIRAMIINSGALNQPGIVLVDLLCNYRNDLQDVLEQRFYYEQDERGRLFIRRKNKPLKRKYRLDKCGAKTRKGTPCQILVVLGKKRCRLHGGCSTGPKTAEGRARIAESNRQRVRGRQAAQA